PGRLHHRALSASRPNTRQSDRRDVVNPRMQGKVVFVTGAGRGQGREHAVRFAREGADIIAIDLCAPIDSLTYPLSSPRDLQTTEDEVRAAGGRIVAEIADVRSQASLDAALGKGLAEFGHVDVVIANAGIVSGGPAWEIGEKEWHDV